VRTIKLILAYDGTAYAGWQVQPERTTLQGVLEAAIEKLTGVPTRTAASGRTDSGVHALGQVVTFNTESHHPVEVFQRALNAELPPDVAVLSAIEAAPGFHARRDAVRKRYRYVLYDGPVRDVFSRRYAWHVHQPLDVDAMHRAAAALAGTHDFSSFESSGAERASSVRTVYDISVRREPAPREEFLRVEVEANGFLYNMVRAIVGTLVEVGRKARPESWPGEVLEATDRSAGGQTAPPQGLFLVEVEYP